ncbi:MAG: hypothetical protein RIR51_210 [Bacteroidota bacterium]
MRKILFLVLFIIAPIVFFGQSKRINERFQIHMKKFDQPIKVDGILDDFSWEDAPKVDGFYSVNPIDSVKSKINTEVLLGYDDKYFYLAAICYTKENQRYVVESLRRDFMFNNNDNFLFFMDTYDDLTTGYSFGSNAAGAQWDAQHFDGARANLNWDNKWESAVSSTPNAWILEMRIPFKSIRYKADSKRWGVNFSRLDVTELEKSSWVIIPRQFPTASSAYFGVLIWDNPPPAPKKNISFIPYALTRSVNDFEHSTGNMNSSRIGADAKIALSSSMNLDLTVNPDFSQVDVDVQQTNLDRYELFYPERRQFFIENSDLFDGFGTQTLKPFFSRRIGLSYNPSTGIYEQSPVSYGARLSGKINNNLRLGALNVQTKSNEAKGVPTENFSMVAVQQKVFARSNFGAFLINKETNLNSISNSNGYLAYNRNLGLEYNLASKNNFWTGKMFYYKSITPQNLKENYAQGTSLSYTTNRWDLNWNHQIAGANYNPEVGYSPRSNYFFINPRMGINLYPKNPNSSLFFYKANLMIMGFWNLGGANTDLTKAFSHTFNFKDKSRILFWTATDYIKLLLDFNPFGVGNLKLKKGEEHRWKSVGFNYESTPINSFTYSIDSRFGGYYGGGSRIGISSTLKYRIQPFGYISVNFDYNKIDDVSVPNFGEQVAQKGSAEFWIIRPKLDVTFTNKLFFSTFFQINQQTKNINLNSRLQWRYQPASDLFLVYTDNYFPETYNIRSRAIVLKLNYWLNL